MKEHVVGKTFYNSHKDKIIALECNNSEYFKAKVIKERIVIYNCGKNKDVNYIEEEEEYPISSIGCYIYYSIEDSLLGKALLSKVEYKWNYSKMKEYYDAIDKRELDEIIANAPSTEILDEISRQELIKNYTNESLQREEEIEFYKKYPNKYFARMDFDVNYYKYKKRDLFENHYYNKIYIGKQGRVLDENGKLVIADWRSPIGGFMNDDKNRFFNPEVDERFCYDYELLLKRRFSQTVPGDYKNMFIADVDLYKDGDMDPFLIDVLTRLRRSGNDKAVDIIETIQAEQNRIVRENLEQSFYVQGCAGSGKTMIMLHRLSCLMYNNNNLDTKRIKIITPNENIINQLKELSAQLEISNIEQLTLEKYFLLLIKNYSEKLYINYSKNIKKLGNESLLNKEFLEYVYSDDFKNKLDISYINYFDALFILLKEKTIFQNYTHEELSNNIEKLFLLSKRFEESKNNRDSLLKEKSNIEQELEIAKKKYKQFLKEHKYIADVLKNIEKLENNKYTLENLQLEINAINESKDILNSKILIKEEYKKQLTDFEDYKTIENQGYEPLNDLDSVLDLITKKEIIIKKCLKDKEDIELSIYNIAKNEVEVINNLKELEANYEMVSKLNFIKKLSISNRIQKERAKQFNLQVEHDKEQDNLKKAINNIALVNEQLSQHKNNAYTILVNMLERTRQEINSLNNDISTNEKRIEQLAKKEKINFNDIKQEISKIEIEITNLKDSLTNDEKEIDKYTVTINSISEKIQIINKKIEEVYPYSPQEEKEIFRHFNKFLQKNEYNEYTPTINITETKLISDIVTPIIEEVYTKYLMIKDEKFYKFSLYITLYILQKFLGKRKIDFLINIDEAQDITHNEYLVIKNSNIDAIFNLYGDTNQLLYKNRGIEKWDLLSEFNLKGFKLNINYRNIEPITRFCNNELESIKMQPMGVNGDEVKIISNINDIGKEYLIIVKNKDYIKEVFGENTNYNFIESKEDMLVKEKINVMTVEMAKGMEFPKVVVYDKDMIKREKYIAYTRALNTLKVLR